MDAPDLYIDLGITNNSWKCSKKIEGEGMDSTNLKSPSLLIYLNNINNKRTMVERELNYLVLEE